MWPDFQELKRQDAQHRRAQAMWEGIREHLPGPVDPGLGGLTICSVGYRAKACLNLNAPFVRTLNPGTPPPTWLLLDNNLDPAEQFDVDDPRFTVSKQTTRDIDMGYEHALGVSTLLAQVRTRFLLLLDPDCFVVMPDWIRSVTDHMIEHELGFFGTPINPRRANSYRYFPYMVCMFVDLARVPLRDLCFLPSVWDLWTNVTYRMRKAVAGVPKAGLLFRWLLTEQWHTNGWQIKARFGNAADVRFECTQPVWDVNQMIPPGSIKRLIHTLTPGSVAPVPKQAGYCTADGFVTAGAPDLAGRGWEEFMWHGQPFAFHLGGAHSRDPEAYLPPLTRVLGEFAERAPAALALALR